MQHDRKQSRESGKALSPTLQLTSYCYGQILRSPEITRSLRSMQVHKDGSFKLKLGLPTITDGEVLGWEQATDWATGRLTGQLGPTAILECSPKQYIHRVFIRAVHNTLKGGNSQKPTRWGEKYHIFPTYLGWPAHAWLFSGPAIRVNTHLNTWSPPVR